MKKTLNKIEIEIFYCTGLLKEISDFMERCDLAGAGITETFVITTSAIITDRYLEKTKKILTEAIEDQGGKVYKIISVKIIK